MCMLTLLIGGWLLYMYRMQHLPELYLHVANCISQLFCLCMMFANVPLIEMILLIAVFLIHWQWKHSNDARWMYEWHGTKYSGWLLHIALTLHPSMHDVGTRCAKNNMFILLTFLFVVDVCCYCCYCYLFVFGRERC